MKGTPTPNFVQGAFCLSSVKTSRILFLFVQFFFFNSCYLVFLAILRYHVFLYDGHYVKEPDCVFSVRNLAIGKRVSQTRDDIVS
jgi:hypothetical protein